MAARRVEHVGLRAAVDHGGRKWAARRFGVSERTIGDWLRRGVPERRARAVSEAVRRSERASRAAARAAEYRRLGWRRLRSWRAVDEFIGAEPGHSRDRWEHRQEWWDEHRPDEYIASRAAVVRDADGRLLYVNGDYILWRGYVVDGRLFWTHATNLDGYDTAEEFAAAYETLGGRAVQIHFGV